MDSLSTFLVIGMVVCMPLCIWAVYDLYMTFFMYSRLVQSLAQDPEFLHRAPHVWECDWQDQCEDEQFKRLRTIIRDHIDGLRFRNPKQILWPLNQAHLINRFRYVRGLARAAEKRAHQV
jgi:hypothetical protein